MAVEPPGSDWSGIQRGSVLGPHTRGDRRVLSAARTCSSCMWYQHWPLVTLKRGIRRHHDLDIDFQLDFSLD